MTEMTDWQFTKWRDDQMTAYYCGWLIHGLPMDGWRNDEVSFVP